jgi:cyclic pyranopterin phosphate synthase
MVDVGVKPATRRQAQVSGCVRLSADAMEAIDRDRLAKGDAFTVAKIAGIQAAKRTAELIPLCHPLPIDHLDVTFAVDRGAGTIRVTAVALTTARTGIEMEAFVAASVAALALYDMVKAIDPGATITQLQLIRKTGGKRPFQRVPAPQAGRR